LHLDEKRPELIKSHRGKASVTPSEQPWKREEKGSQQISEETKMPTYLNNKEKIKPN
jgi:hypothetical protein